MIQLGDDAAHAVIAQAAGVVGGGDEAVAQSVHLGHGADHAGVAEVILEHAAGQTGAGGGLHRDDAVIGLAPEHLAHKGGDQAAQVGAAAGAADDDVGLDAVLLQRGLGLKADDGLVQQHLIQHAAQHIAIALAGGGGLHSLADGAAQRAGGAGELSQNLAAHLGGVGGRGGHVGAVGAHDLAAEGLLLIGALHHEHAAVQSQIGAGHAERRAPLTGAGLGGNALQALLLGIVGLRDGGVQLVAAGGVVALELVVDLRRGLELLLQTVGTHQRRGPVHLIEVADILGNLKVGGGIVHLLLHQLGAEHTAQLLGGHGLQGAGVQQGCGLVGHVRANIVPIFGHLILGQVDLVGDVSVLELFHDVSPLYSIMYIFLFTRNNRSSWRA